MQESNLPCKQPRGPFDNPTVSITNLPQAQLLRRNNHTAKTPHLKDLLRKNLRRQSALTDAALLLPNRVQVPLKG
jgi:hypothetical protein